MRFLTFHENKRGVEMGVESLQIVFSFLWKLVNLTELLYKDVPLFYVTIYLLGVSSLVRFLYWVAIPSVGE